MFKCLLILFLINWINGQTIRDDIPVWPYPLIYQDTTTNPKKIAISSTNFDFTIKDRQNEIISQNQILTAAMTRYRLKFFKKWNTYPSQAEIQKKSNTFNTPSSFTNLFFSYPQLEQEEDPAPTILNRMQIIITDLGTSLPYEADEHYELKISSKNGIILDSRTIWGVLRGLETFSQIIQWSGNGNLFFIPKTPITVKDEPRFPWRGLMIDVARHYLSIRNIKHIIDSMEYAKLNTLHLHLYDSESFPFILDGFPQLAEKGRFWEGLVYTKTELSEIVEYGLYRGIKVVPEFNMPGHTNSWKYAFPNTTANCPHDASKDINNVVLNPLEPFIYKVIETMLGEMQHIFPLNFVHLGANKISYSCWLEDPTIRKYMENRNMTVQQLQAYFQNILTPIYQKFHKSMICWHDLLFTMSPSDYAPPIDTIIQIWEKSSNYYSRSIKLGYQTLLSDGWFLDSQIPVQSGRGGSGKWVDTWRDMYMVEPYEIHDFQTDEKYLAIGGEACMWGETVDYTNIDSMIWPRVAAVAERLWSPMWVNDTEKAEKRLMKFRCFVLRKRGIKAGPVGSDFCPFVYLEEEHIYDLMTNSVNPLFSQISYIGFSMIFAFLMLLATLSFVCGCFYWNQYKRAKSKWIGNMFSDDTKILISDHRQSLQL